MNCENCSGRFDNCTLCSALRKGVPTCDCEEGYFSNVYSGMCQPNFYYGENRRMLAQAVELVNSDQTYTPNGAATATAYNYCPPY